MKPRPGYLLKRWNPILHPLANYICFRYGFFESSNCTDSEIANCESTSIISNVFEQCYGKEQCIIDPTGFQDPCSHVNSKLKRTLEVLYNCTCKQSCIDSFISVLLTVKLIYKPKLKSNGYLLQVSVRFCQNLAWSFEVSTRNLQGILLVSLWENFCEGYFRIHNIRITVLHFKLLIFEENCSSIGFDFIFNQLKFNRKLIAMKYKKWKSSNGKSSEKALPVMGTNKKWRKYDPVEQIFYGINWPLLKKTGRLLNEFYP